MWFAMSPDDPLRDLKTIALKEGVLGMIKLIIAVVFELLYDFELNRLVFGLLILSGLISILLCMYLWASLQMDWSMRYPRIVHSARVGLDIILLLVIIIRALSTRKTSDIWFYAIPVIFSLVLVIGLVLEYRTMKTLAEATV